MFPFRRVCRGNVVFGFLGLGRPSGPCVEEKDLVHFESHELLGASWVAI